MNCKKLFMSLGCFAIAMCSALAIELNVGETTELNLGTIHRLEKCQWKISRPDAVKFVELPDKSSTSVIVKAIKLLEGPCTVECTYYYYSDIDPRTGEHMFIRSKTKRWEINPTVAESKATDLTGKQ